MDIGHTLNATVCKVMANGYFLQYDSQQMLLLATKTGETAEVQRKFASTTKVGDQIAVQIVRYVAEDNIYVVRLADEN